MGIDIGASLLLVAAAMVAKLGSSGDDVIWFLPFVAGRKPRVILKHVCLYVGTLEFIVLLSALIAWLGNRTLDALIVGLGLPWSAQRVLQVIAAAFLALYALHLYRKSRKGDQDSDEGDGDKEHSGWQAVVFISFMGSLDELSYFPVLIAGKTFTLSQLLVGTALAGAVVVAICLGATRFEVVVKTIERVPLWGIIGAFAVLTLLS